MGSTGQPTSLRAFLFQALQQLVPALVVYFGLRAFGAAPYLALGAAVLFALAHTVVEALRGRDVDFFLLAVILLYAVSAIITFVTKNPRYAQVANMLPGAVANAAILGSVAIGKPLTQLVAAKYRPKLAADALPGRGWTAQDIRDYAAMHRRVSLVCGLLGLGQTGATITVIFTCPVDVAQLVCDVAGTGTTVLIVVAAVRTIRRFISARDKDEGQPQAETPLPA